MDFAAATFTIIAPEEGHTLAKVLRSRLHEQGPSWTQVRGLIHGRRVTINGGVCVDEARRLKEGDTIVLGKQGRPAIARTTPIVIRHLDEHIVVVEKPPGVSSVRHPAELDWPEEKRRLDPTLQDLTQWQIAHELNRPVKNLPPLRIVHRLDRDTSGLLVFARGVLAERGLGHQFRQHTVERRYLALVPGKVLSQTIESTLIRDRGDGRRGSTRQPDVTGKRAVTHIEVVQAFRDATLLACRLETGRTHQIRIHLAELGHPVAGEKVYTHKIGGKEWPSVPGCPRLFLHAEQLGFEHPVTLAAMRWDMPLTRELMGFLRTLPSN